MKNTKRTVKNWKDHRSRANFSWTAEEVENNQVKIEFSIFFENWGNRKITEVGENEKAAAQKILDNIYIQKLWSLVGEKQRIYGYAIDVLRGVYGLEAPKNNMKF